MKNSQAAIKYCALMDQCLITHIIKDYNQVG